MATKKQVRKAPVKQAPKRAKQRSRFQVETTDPKIAKKLKNYRNYLATGAIPIGTTIKGETPKSSGEVEYYEAPLMPQKGAVEYLIEKALDRMNELSHEIDMVGSALSAKLGYVSSENNPESNKNDEESISPLIGSLRSLNSRLEEAQTRMIYMNKLQKENL